jgi:hypothetical protein
LIVNPGRDDRWAINRITPDGGDTDAVEASETVPLERRISFWARHTFHYTSSQS